MALVIPQGVPGWLLAQARAVQGVRFDRECAVIRPVLAANGLGGKARSESTVATLRCALGEIESRTAAELRARGLLLTSADQAVTVAFGSDVRVTDLLLIGGVRYEVVFVTPLGSMQTALVAVVRVAGA